MKILSIEFIHGANEDTEDLEDDKRYSDRRIKINYRDRHGNKRFTELAPVSSTPYSWIQYGNGQENFSLLADRLAFWLHGGELCTTTQE